jgi:hypothetical protein
MWIAIQIVGLLGTACILVAMMCVQPFPDHIVKDRDDRRRTGSKTKDGA